MLMIGYGVLKQVHRKDDTWPKIPSQSWHELYRELVAWYDIDPEKAVELEDFLNQGDYNKIGEEIMKEVAGGKIKLQKLKAIIAEKLLCSPEHIINIRKTHHLGLHELLAEIPFIGTITTTYDVFMDRAYFLSKGKEIERFYLQDVQKASKYLVEKTKQNPLLFPFVMKLHGDITPRKEIILDDLYLEKYLTDNLILEWRRFFRQCSVLFLGFEPDTPDLHCLVYLFEKKVFSSLYDHWIVLPSNETSQQVFDQKLKGTCSRLYAIYSGQSGLEGFLQLLHQYEANQQAITQMIIEEIPAAGNTTYFPELTQPVIGEIFILHAPEDENWKTQLAKRLSGVPWPHPITIWDISQIDPGQDHEKTIAHHLQTASVFLLLVSPDFLKVEKQTLHMKIIMDRRKEGNVIVIPILVRSISFLERDATPYGNLEFLPPGDKALSDRSDRDKAYIEIINGVYFTIYPKSSQ